MNNQPLVSVLVPSYNHGKFVEQTIESIVNQTYKNIELLVIDDGSSDKSPEILSGLSAKYKFYFEGQENMSLIPTLNKLFDKAKGKYIAVCASDDLWLLDKIEKQVKFMEENSDIAICFGNVLQINQDGEIFPYYCQRFYNFKSYVFKDILSNRHYLPALTAMWRKSVYDKVGPWDDKGLCEDLNMWLKVSHLSYKIVILKNLMGFHRIHESNISKNNIEMFKGKRYLIKQYKGNKGYFEGLTKTYLHYFFHLVYSVMPFDFGFKRK